MPSYTIENFVGRKTQPWNSGLTLNDYISKYPLLTNQVTKEPLYHDSQRIGGKFATVRRGANDAHVVHGVVGRKYEVVQDVKLYESVLTLFPDRPNCIDYAGVIADGGKTFISVKLAETEILKDDVVKTYLIASNSHDGFAIKVFLAPVRLACWNQLGSLSASAIGAHVIRHSGDTGSRISRATDALAVDLKKATKVTDLYKGLARATLSNEQVNQFLNRYIPISPDAGSAKAANQHQLIRDLAEYGTGQDIKGVRGTAWAYYNAVTELLDHKPLSAEESADDRRSTLWFGGVPKRKDSALAILKEVAGIK